MTERDPITCLLQRLRRKLIRESHLRKNPADSIEGLSPYQVRKLQKAINEALDVQRARRDFVKTMEERRG